jgi:hypothetical protein
MLDKRLQEDYLAPVVGMTGPAWHVEHDMSIEHDRLLSISTWV